MVRKKEKLTVEYALSNKHREKISKLCEEPKSFTQLQKMMKISAGSMAHHLKVLKDVGIITREEVKVEGKRKVGAEVSIKTTEKYKEYKEKEPDYDEPIFQEINTFKVLTALKKFNKPLTSEELEKDAKTNIDIDYYLENLSLHGLIDTKYSITKEGLSFLKKKRKYKKYEKVYPNE